MKKTIFCFFIFIFSLVISNRSFAFNLDGWWGAENGNPHLKIIKIHNNTLNGMKFQIIDRNHNQLKIQIYVTKYNPADAIIETINENEIIITYASGNRLIYRLITNDISIPKAKVKQMMQ